MRPRPARPRSPGPPVSAIAHAAVESPMSALPATSRKSSRSRHTATSTPASPSGPSTPISSSSSTSHRTSRFAPLSRARESDVLAGLLEGWRPYAPWPPKAPSSSRKRAGGSSIGGLSRGSSFGVQATSGARVGLYGPAACGGGCSRRNSARSAKARCPPSTGRGRTSRPAAAGRGCPSRRPRARHRPHGAVLLEGFLGEAARLAGDLVERRALHGVLEALEGDLSAPCPLRPSCTWRLRSLRSRSWSGMPTGHASQQAPHRLEAWGRSLASFAAFEERGDDGADGARSRSSRRRGRRSGGRPGRRSGRRRSGCSRAPPRTRCRAAWSGRCP